MCAHVQAGGIGAAHTEYAVPQLSPVGILAATVSLQNTMLRTRTPNACESGLARGVVLGISVAPENKVVGRRRVA